MGVYNKDGFISGGFIFDELDKFAQQMVEHRSNHKYNFTHYFMGGFWKQLCEVDYYCGFNWLIKIPFHHSYLIKVYMKNRKGVKIATAYFTFVGKEKNYCKTINIEVRK